MKGITARVMGNPRSSLLGLGGAVLTVATAYGWTTQEQSAALAGLLAVVGGLMRDA